MITDLLGFLGFGWLFLSSGAVFSSIKEDKAEDQLKYWETSSVGGTPSKYRRDSG